MAGMLPFPDFYSQLRIVDTYVETIAYVPVKYTVFPAHVVGPNPNQSNTAGKHLHTLQVAVTCESWSNLLASLSTTHAEFLGQIGNI
jgi:hypothetical protein